LITRERFELIRNRHGKYGSWAVWQSQVGGKPKSGMGEMGMFSDHRWEELLPLLRPNVLMVGLNFSRSLADPQPFRNFHDPSPRANDFKIRHAFVGTEFYGAYMTDVIKLFEEVDSKEVIRHLRNNPDLIEENIRFFRHEISDLGAIRPTILAFGKDAYALLKSALEPEEYGHLIKLTHYSHRIEKESYRREVWEQIRMVAKNGSGFNLRQIAD
jgi:hypothetical protein